MFGPGKIPFCSSSLFFAASVFALVCLTGLQPNAIQSSGQAEISSLLPKPAAFNTNAAQVQEQDRRRIEAAYAKLPLSFEPNRGQTDARVKFLSRAGRRTLWLTKDEAVLAIAPLRAGSGEKQEVARKQNQSAPAVLRMKFVGANADPKITGEARQAGLVNYLRSKPGESRTGIPTYARVRYSSLYPGIDLVFYGNNRFHPEPIRDRSSSGFPAPTICALMQTEIWFSRQPAARSSSRSRRSTSAKQPGWWQSRAIT
jgi:hypothetical protein